MPTINRPTPPEANALRETLIAFLRDTEWSKSAVSRESGIGFCTLGRFIGGAFPQGKTAAKLVAFFKTHGKG